MTRRATSLLAIAVSTVALTGCATFSNVDRVASVNGVDITRDDYEHLADDFFAYPDVFAAEPVQAGRGDGAAARNLLSIAVQIEVLRELVGDEAFGAGVESAIAAAPDDVPVDEMSAEMRELYGAVTARGGGLLAEVAPPDEAELEALYERRPAEAGVMCVRHILVATKAEADDVVAELAGGADFAELAAEVSTDEASGVDGGLVPSASGPCWTLGQALGPSGLVATFTGAALPLRPGVVSEPVQSDFGWHVIEQLPWNEVSDAVVAVHAEGVTGDVQYVSALLTADVDVDPTLGVWDPAAVAVVPLG